MSTRALVVDDDPDIVRTVGDIITSLGHAHDAAGDVEATRKLLAAGEYDYLVLDMNIPVGPRRLSRKENGKNLLAELRTTPRLAGLPVIVITGEARNDPEFAASIMKTGGAFTEFVQKPFDGDKLDRTIGEALHHRTGRPVTASTAGSVSPQMTPFPSERRTMAIFEDRITVCGVEIWRDHGQADLRETLKLLSRRDRHGYVRITGAELDQRLGRNASNPIARPIKSFRDTAGRLLRDIGLDCGPEDIIASGRGGYRFTSWMAVEVAGSENSEPQRDPAGETEEPDGSASCNERQRWILEQLREGARLTFRDIQSHTKKAQATVKRDLRELRERGTIVRHEDGHYVPTRRPDHQ